MIRSIMIHPDVWLCIGIMFVGFAIRQAGRLAAYPFDKAGELVEWVGEIMARHCLGN